MFPKIQVRSDGGFVTFGGNQKGFIVGEGTVGKEPLPVINNVLLVEGLKHNLLSISQLCDSGFTVSFNKVKCSVTDTDDKIIFEAQRQGNLYKTNLENLANQNVTCLVSSEDNTWLWHRKLGHASLRTITKIISNDLVRGLPKLSIKSDATCSACTQSKQHRTSCRAKNFVSTSKPLDLLHMDLFGPTRVASVSGKRFCFVIIDDYTRFCWVYFLRSKDETFQAFKIDPKAV